MTFVARLVDREPHWIITGGEGITDANGNPMPKRYVGVSFACPCGCGVRGGVEFTKAIDGSPHDSGGWDRDGDTFETLTVRPSIKITLNERDGEHWHGYLRNGSFVT